MGLMVLIIVGRLIRNSIALNAMVPTTVVVLLLAH